MNITRSTRFVLIMAAAAIIAAGCTSTADESTTTTEATTTTGSTGAQDVEFGSGSIPETFPSAFPVPEQAVIGTTLVDRIRSNTEVILTLPSDVLEAKAYFEENLPGRDFEIDTSDGTDASWRIEFSGDDGSGVILIDTGGAGVSVVAVQYSTA